MNNDISTNPNKVKALQEFPIPTNLTKSRLFIGLVSYYCRFVENLSKIASPITELTEKGCPFVWDKAQQTAFQRLKDILSNAPILAHYNPSYETLVETNASFFGLGFHHLADQPGNLA